MGGVVVVNEKLNELYAQAIKIIGELKLPGETHDLTDLAKKALFLRQLLDNIVRYIDALYDHLAPKDEEILKFKKQMVDIREIVDKYLQ